jgi:hypothetical protein
MEKYLTTDEEILEYYGWTEVCQSPHELQNIDGSFASGQAVSCVLNSIREEYINEKYEEFMEEMRELGIKNKILKKNNEEITKCPLCGETMNSIELTHFKCKKCDEYFTN